MNTDSTAGIPYQGYLPSRAPLANPYVPFQMEQPAMYDPPRGLIRGTIYPGLDLPFMRQSNQCPLPDTIKSRLLALKFAINELALYLDTHNDDLTALRQYRTFQQQYAQTLPQYEAKYGPLTHNQESDDTEYLWLSDPWPWEYSK